MAKKDLNVAPWFDDFDSGKNFMRVLYRPGRAVQARELNQTQSIFQNQLSSFANHIFKNGSKVSNARTSLQTKAFVRLTGTPNVEGYVGAIRLYGETSGISATLVRAVNADAVDPATLYIVYTGTAIDGSTSTFIPGENIRVWDENEIEIDVLNVRCPSCPGSGLDDTIPPTGKGQFFSVDDGIFYFEGMFIEVPAQELIVTKYLVYDEAGNITNFVPCKIGLDFVQSIVTHVEDASLLDPSLGYPNSTAPGADRYKVEMILVKRAYNDEDGEDFVPLVRLGEGMKIEFMKSDSEYSNIMDTMAKRTFETNGDYTIRPFRVSFLNAKKATAIDPHGYSVNGSPDNLVAMVTPSVAYVKGYRVETVSDTPVAFPKARDTKKISSFVKHFDARTYVLGKPAGPAIWPNGSANPSTMSNDIIQLFDGVATASSAAGTVIGNLKVSDAEYVAGSLTDNSAIYRYYVYDVQMNAGQVLSNAKSLVRADGGFYTNIVPDTITNRNEVYNANRSGLLYRIDRDDVKSLRDINDPLNGSMNLNVRRKLSGVANGSGSVTFSTSANEFFENAGPGFIVWAENNGVKTSYHGPSVATVTPTSMTLNLGSAAAGASVYVIVDVLKTNQTEKQKVATNFTYLSNTAPSGIIGGIVALGVADAYNLRSVKVFVDGAPDVEIADVTNEFRLDANIDDQAYRESRLIRTAASSVALNSSHRIAVNFDFFQHSGTQGFFTIDSYAAAFAAEDSGITYETLGTYESKAKISYPLASTIDFRPIVMGSNPITAVLPANASTAIFDIEYYLGRADILQINKDGQLYIKQGEPSETPRIPKVDDNAMKLYEIWLKPYTYSLKDISTKYVDNRRYTMRDIGSIEKRLTNVEYITALNVLEKSVADMSVKDDNGLDRFKNGFIADNFQDFQAADLTHSEFRASADRTQRHLRPSFKASNRKLKFNPIASAGFQLLGNVAVRPFTESSVANQPYATKHLSINPYLMYNQRGTMVLSPNNDVWTDETTVPDMVVDIDAGVEAFTQLSEASGILGTDWGSWVDQNRTILGTAQTTDVAVGIGATTTTTTTSTTSQTTAVRTGTATTVESRVDTYTIDDIVKDVQIIPFVRTRDVEFYATKLKANTRVYAFFDGTPVSEFCRDIGFQLSEANAGQASQLVSFGSPLITDANGELRGVFRIPEGRFFVGEKKFALSDDPKLSGDTDLESTFAESVYFAGGLDVTKQNVSLNVITPSFTTEQVTETRQEVDTTTSRESTTVVTQQPFTLEDECVGNESVGRFLGWECACATGRDRNMCDDPVAQAFVLNADTFVSSLDIYFKQVDVFSDRLFVELRTMVNGYPSATVLSKKYYTPDQIQPFCSDDSSRAFRVNWDVPVFLEGKTQYCFVVGGASPNSRIWVARLGEEVANMPGKIVESPATTEVSFRSLNGSTWNAEQFEQIKYNLNQATFEPGTMHLVFENDHEDETFALDFNPFQTQVGQTRVRVFHKNHGLTETDRVSLSLFENVPFLVQMSDFVPQIGQKMHTTTGSGTVNNVVAASGANQYMITLSNVSGILTAGQTYTCDVLVKSVRDWHLVSSMDSQKPQSYTLNQCSGSVLENSYGTKYPLGSIAGIPISEFNSEHVTGSQGHSVVEVDSMDTYIINVQTPATVTGRFGGEVLAYNGNEKYEVFNVSGAYLPYRAIESWALTGIGHGTTGTLFEGANYRPQPGVAFTPQEDKFLGQPYKIASRVNEQIMLSGGKSVSIAADFTTSNSASSPVVNLDTFSITTVSNRVEMQDRDALVATPIGDQTWVAEQNFVGGTEKYKYVTRTVNLQNPASDIHMYVDVYKDINADFDVYIKRTTPEDGGSIDDKPWMKVTALTKNRSSVDMTDFIEYRIVASEHIIPYIENGETYGGWLDADGEIVQFTSFAVKLVGKTQNSAKPPLFKALRIIAVT